MHILNQKHEQVPVHRLAPHPRNPNVGNVEAIQASIDENGWYGAIIAQKNTGHILVGHHRYQAAVQAGADKVPVFWIDVDDTRALKILLADNKTAELATRDDERLAEVLRELAEGDAGLIGSGYDTSDLNTLLAGLETEEASPPSLIPDHDRYREQYGVIVLCSDEAQQEKIYTELTASGHTCKVVVT